MPLLPRQAQLTLTDGGIRWTAARDINLFGWHVSAVGPLDGTPAEYVVYATYTVGLYKRHEHAELVLLGLEPQVAYVYLAGIRDRILMGASFEDGQEVKGLVKSHDPKNSVVFRSASSTDRIWPLRAANLYYAGKPFPVLQVVLPDPAGLYPWDEGVEPVFKVPLL